LPARPALRAAAIVAVVHALPLVDRAAFAAVLERVRADLWLTDLQLGLAASLPRWSPGSSRSAARAARRSPHRRSPRLAAGCAPRRRRRCGARRRRCRARRAVR
jgi:hypothetical protein